MCYHGEANSIWPCNEHLTNSRMLSIDCRYFKGNSHSMCLCRVCSMPRQMPNRVQMYYSFCLASLPHATFGFRCKPGLSLFGTTEQCYQPQTKISDSNFWMTFAYDSNCEKPLLVENFESPLLRRSWQKILWWNQSYIWFLR